MSLLLLYSLRSVIRRKWITVSTVLGLAFATAVMLAVAALVQAFDGAIKSTGAPSRLLVIRKGAQAELASGISASLVESLRAASYSRGEHPPGTTFVAERLGVVVLQRKGTNDEGNAAVRGTSPSVGRVRPEVKIIEGRWFEPGRREVVVGSFFRDRFEHTSVGDTLDFGKAKWTVVGVFSAGGTAFDSEMWVDVEQFASDFDRFEYSSATVRLPSEEAAEHLRRKLAEDLQFRELQVVHESTYYEEQTKAALPVKVIGSVVAAFLFIGGVFALSNTMFSSVWFRAREIAVLRVLGFPRALIVGTFLAESLLLSSASAVVAIAGLAPLSGFVAGTHNAVTFSDLAFKVQLTARTVWTAVLLAVSLALLGGGLPAFRASRLACEEHLRG